MRPLALRVLLAALVVSACTTRQPAPAPTPTPTTRPPLEAPPLPSTPVPARFAYRAGKFTYKYVASGTVTMRGDTIRGGDPLATVAVITYALAGDARRLRITGTVDSFTVSGGSRTVGAPQRLTTPIPFAGTIDQGAARIDFSTPFPGECGSPVGPALAAAEELLIAVPAALTSGNQWSDTSSTTLCRGGVILTTTMVHRYSVDGPDTYEGAAAFRISRQTDVSYSGTGGPAAAGATLTGHGTNTALLYIDPVGGRLMGGRGENTAELTLNAGTRVQNFTQKTAMRIVLRSER